MPPKKKQGPVVPAPSPGPNPADPGNPNAPANPTSPAPVAGYTPAGSATDPNTGQTIEYGTLDVSAGNVSTTITLGQNVDPQAHVMLGAGTHGPGQSRGGTDEQPTWTTVQGMINSIDTWYNNATQRQQYINQMYEAGLISSKKSPSATDVIRAWSLIVQEASIRGNVTPDDLLSQAAKSGYNALSPTLTTSDFGGANSTGNLNNVPDSSTTTSETDYKSYLDPATIMGALADSYYRLVGRNPSPEEYKAFLDTVYGYQDEENTGKFETKTKSPSGTGQIDPTTGQPVSPQGTNDGSTDPTTTTNVVSQRSIGTRGLEFLAGQAALGNPDEPNYQAATTYFNAFIKALSGPASGMQSSGPTTTVP